MQLPVHSSCVVHVVEFALPVHNTGFHTSVCAPHGGSSGSSGSLSFTDVQVCVGSAHGSAKLAHASTVSYAVQPVGTDPKPAYAARVALSVVRVTGPGIAAYGAGAPTAASRAAAALVLHKGARAVLKSGSRSTRLGAAAVTPACSSGSGRSVGGRGAGRVVSGLYETSNDMSTVRGAAPAGAAAASSTHARSTREGREMLTRGGRVDSGRLAASMTGNESPENM